MNTRVKGKKEGPILALETDMAPNQQLLGCNDQRTPEPQCRAGGRKAENNEKNQQCASVASLIHCPPRTTMDTPPRRPRTMGAKDGEQAQGGDGPANVSVAVPITTEVPCSSPVGAQTSITWVLKWSHSGYIPGLWTRPFPTRLLNPGR